MARYLEWWFWIHEWLHLSCKYPLLTSFWHYPFSIFFQPRQRYGHATDSFEESLQLPWSWQLCEVLAPWIQLLWGIKHLDKVFHFLHLRSNSERDPVARRFLEKNFPKPLQLLFCNCISIISYIVLAKYSHLIGKHALLMYLGLRNVSSRWRRTKWCQMAKRWDYSNWNLKWTIIGCSCICPWWQVGLYCAGFPCKPFSYLNAKSRLLKEKHAKPLYQVIRHLKTTAPAVPCLLVSNWHKIILFDLSFFAGMHLRQFYWKMWLDSEEFGQRWSTWLTSTCHSYLVRVGFIESILGWIHGYLVTFCDQTRYAIALLDLDPQLG